MENVFVCKSEDDFVFERPRWIAHLSNGEKIIQDDGRPGVNPPQAWLRLKEYCRQNSLSMVNLTLQFRSHHEAPLPTNAWAYYFINKIAAVQGGPTLGFYLIGVVGEDGKLKVQHWKIPELLCFGEEIRNLEEAGESIIWRNNDKESARIFAKEN